MTTQTATKVYRAHVAGFFGDFLSLDALRAWADAKRRQFALAGTELLILQGTRHGGVDVYAPNCPRKTVKL